MTNVERMTKFKARMTKNISPRVRSSNGRFGFRISSFIRHLNFVIRHSQQSSYCPTNMLSNLQWLAANGNNGEISGGMLLEVRVDGVASEAIH